MVDGKIVFALYNSLFRGRIPGVRHVESIVVVNEDDSVEKLENTELCFGDGHRIKDKSVSFNPVLLLTTRFQYQITFHGNSVLINRHLIIFRMLV
jgi:hypothetical protein